ncbi:MAG: TetR family transcriptional regulator C-terminal domain-containing protein [Aestuariivirgaceae bacterium]
MGTLGVKKAETSGRKASKEVRRRQLIEATIEVLAKRGFADLTLAEVSDRAGLSRGIVNFHFESKDKLLIETLRSMAQTYRAHWQSAVAGAGPCAVEKMWALIAADFDKAVCNRKYIAAWSVFRAEAKSRPLYRAICGDHDAAFQQVLADMMAQIAADDGSECDSGQLALGLDCLLEGLWLQILMQPGQLSRGQAHACAVEHLVALFPAQFTRRGPTRAKQASSHSSIQRAN